MSYNRPPTDFLSLHPDPKAPNRLARIFRRPVTAIIAGTALVAALGVKEAPAIMHHIHNEKLNGEYEAQLGRVIEPSLISLGNMILRMPGSHMSPDGHDTTVQATKTADCWRVDFSATMLPRSSKSDPSVTVAASESIERVDTAACDRRGNPMATEHIQITSPEAANSNIWSETDRIVTVAHASGANTETLASSMGGLPAAREIAKAAIQYAGTA